MEQVPYRIAERGMIFDYENNLALLFHAPPPPPPRGALAPARFKVGIDTA
jgi:hypothetical protein